MSDTEISAPFDAGPWDERVLLADRGGFAYRPGEVLVPFARAEEAHALLEGREGQPVEGEEAEEADAEAPPALRRDEVEIGGHDRFMSVVRTLDAVDELRAAGIPAHPNYVLFSHCQCCCGGSPTWTFAGNPFAANPFAANPFAANPFAANPFAANPFAANPFAANPTSATYQRNPLTLQGEENSPEVNRFRRSGRRRHSARPADPPELPEPPADGVPAPTVVVIDTGLADLHQPGALRVTDAEDVYRHGNQEVGTVFEPTAHEVWDRDDDDVIDSMAGHGTFIAGIIKMIAPMCRLRVQGPLTGYGDISEHDLTIVLQRLFRNGAPDLLNLSLGGYAVEDMPALGKVVRDLQTAGTVIVASAGNDATCRPTYPAALPGVIAVGALGSYGPAHFTNYGDWVRACAPGVNVVSTFFVDCPLPGGDEFDGWATWSGTSFAAPAVVGALAHAMLADGADLNNPERRREARTRAVHRLIDDPGLFRIPGLGAVVNQTPWWRRRA
jgi:hypothetical protein